MKNNRNGLFVKLGSTYFVLIFIACMIFFFITNPKTGENGGVFTNLLVWTATLFTPIAAYFFYDTWKEQKRFDLMEKYILKILDEITFFDNKILKRMLLVSHIVKPSEEELAESNRSDEINLAVILDKKTLAETKEFIYINLEQINTYTILYQEMDKSNELNELLDEYEIYYTLLMEIMEEFFKNYLIYYEKFKEYYNGDVVNYTQNLRISEGTKMELRPYREKFEKVLENRYLMKQEKFSTRPLTYYEISRMHRLIHQKIVKKLTTELVL